MLKDVFELKTHNRMELINITTEVNFIIEKSSIKTGLVNIYSKHSTSGIVVNEDEPGLLKDFQKALETLVPSNQNYKHDIIDNNADSHIRSFLIGNSETIPLNNGKLDLGTWQSIFFVELDGPRTRKVTVTIV
ncbi:MULTISPECIES: secondary thiamine-phosphate synthase enzyme YjbQ [Methanobacterium]|uniref:Secondary thiamine-phosphate synthase enzyme YjbQ n=1 Tax=Methanobacterium spitsbergense TaxID=2874285 RepID=A0A8T5V0J3_9EURY|nr:MULTISPECIES: secondary thiamine-phosphate synthase enzyme YjbQ [Methanobacterium]MBZ2166970.1 secondary thiamine-phosphate synthase enzyme YjbQ [Methanobacterium spitsbergense]